MKPRVNDEVDSKSRAQKSESKLKSFVTRIGKKFSSGKQVMLEAANEREELWNTVGYHRITGGFFYQYILLLGTAIAGLITISIVYPIFMPYPQITGYQSIIGSYIIGMWVGMFDLGMGGGGGLSDGVTRFIGQYADTNPRQSLKYLSFYIWWEMWMGLVKVTLFMSISMLYFVHTNFAYLVAFIIPQVLVNYPGMCGIMTSAMNSFQRGDKASWLGWTGTVTSVTIDLALLACGKYWGDMNPVYGELMGITIFYCISPIIDNFIPFFIGGYWFAKMLKKRGLKLRDMFDTHLDMRVIKQCLSFTGRQWIAGQLIGVFNYFLGLWILIQLPAWSTWVGLMNIASIFGNIASFQGSMMSSVVPAFSESYNNGKKELCRYFIHDTLKYYTFITGFFLVSLVVISSNIIQSLVIGFPDLQYYLEAAVIVPSAIFTSALGPLQSLPDKIFNACHRPLTPFIINLIVTPTSYFFTFLFLYLCVWTNTLPVWVYMMYPGFFNGMIRTIIAFAWIQKSLIKINYKKIAWQVIGAPVLAGLSYGIVLWIISITFWPWMDGALGTLITMFTHDASAGYQYGVLAGALFMIFAVLFLFPGALYGPFLGIYGGWDEFTLEEFRKCALISGPSRGICMFLYKSFKAFSRISPWYNKFPMNDYEIVQKEAEELITEGKLHALKG